MSNAVRKIVIIGPESTGKSTLSQQLAEALGTFWVPEYARAYLERLNRAYEEADLLKIAQGQLDVEDAMARRAREFLICDTNLHVVKIWSEYRYQRCHPWILEQVAARKYDMYLLTDIDVAWEYDPLREHGAPAMRRHFHRIYRQVVMDSGVPFALVHGDHAQRLRLSRQAVGSLPLGIHRDHPQPGNTTTTKNPGA